MSDEDLIMRSPLGLGQTGADINEGKPKGMVSVIFAISGLLSHLFSCTCYLFSEHSACWPTAHSPFNSLQTKYAAKALHLYPFQETTLQPIVSVSVRGPLTRLAAVSVASALVVPALPVPVILAAVNPPGIPCVLSLMPVSAVMSAAVIPRWTHILCCIVMIALGWHSSAGLCT